MVVSSAEAILRLALIGGMLLLFVGVALVARYIVRPLAGAIGQPLALAFDEPGRLARENAMRNPGRTATTSAALMVGLGYPIPEVATMAATTPARWHRLDRVGELAPGYLADLCVVDDHGRLLRVMQAGTWLDAAAGKGTPDAGRTA